MESYALLLAATLNAGTVLAIAALGLLINEKAGIVNLGAEGSNTGVSLSCTTLSFKPEGLGHNTDGECADGLRNLCHDGSGTGSGSTTLTCGDEDHVSTCEGFFDLFCVVFCSLTANFGVSASTETAGELTSHVKLDVGLTEQECLRISVDGDELNALETEFDHAIDRVNTATADTDDFDDRKVVLSVHNRPPLRL